MPKITLKINGVKRQVTATPDMVLIDLLRKDLKLTGTKQSCDRKGQCGACTVIVDGKAVRSCLKKVVSLEGADVITVEGLGTPDNPHLIQEAFVLAGAVQCGFCTPGMIMAAKALLDQNPDPDVAAIKKALSRNLCRCTGYKKIIEAVQLAGKFLRGETTPEDVRSKLGKSMLGVSHPRPTAMVKACGTALFTADIELPPGAVELAVTLSTRHHAIIKSVDTSLAAKMPGVVGIMTADDIRGTNRIRVSTPDQPLLCEDKVKCLGDPIVIVAAETRDQARAAAAAVKIEYEPLPVMMTPEEALAPGAYQIDANTPNLLFSQTLIKGDAQKAFAWSANIVEAEFSTQMNHQSPLEPEVSAAYLEGEGKDAYLQVIGRSIDIHGHTAQLKEAVGWDNIRYREAFAGGQFGMKASITTEGIVAAAALHFKRPVRYIPSLTESMLLSPKRHPFSPQKVKLAADEKGHITAYSNDFVINKGAYMLLGSILIKRAFYMLSGSYDIPNINGAAKLVRTNNASGGAARGAGPPQVIFALESAVDMLAEKAGIDPLEFRRINSLKPGRTGSTGAVVPQWPFPELCDLIKPHYEQAKKEAAAIRRGSVKRGVGLAAHSFGIGFPGRVANVAVELDPDDGVTIYSAVADPGEGNDSMLTQIAAHLLNMPMDKVRLYTRNTDRALPAGAASGSRMTYVAGGALVLAIEQLQKAMQEAGAKTCVGLQKAGKPTRYVGVRTIPSDKNDPVTYQGDATESHVHNIQMAEVEVNTETGAVRVIKMTSAVDAGTIINPQNIEGQMEGGMDQGVGWALREEYYPGITKDWITFKFPTIQDSFDTEILTNETPRLKGPLGAIGIGEMAMVTTAPAVINAIYNACGVRIYSLPATPEKVKAALSALK